MINYAVATRYSKALFQTTDSSELQEQFLNELKETVKFISQHPDLESLLFNPQINRHAKERILDQFLKDKIHPKLREFFSCLVEMNRFKFLPGIIKEYSRMISQKQGIIEATLITVIPGTPSMKDELQKKLEKAYQKKVIIQEEIDPKILGGAILLIANKMFDYSIKGRLESVKDNLLATRI